MPTIETAASPAAIIAATTAPASTPAPAKPAKAARKPGKAAKPGKPATTAKPGKRTAKPANEASPDKRAERAERIGADRLAVAALYAGFELNRDSVPVKALSAFKPVSSKPNANGRNPSRRQAAAICAALSASGLKLRDGVSFPRVFDVAGVRSCIENGAAGDMLASGLVTVTGTSPETERFTVRAKQAATISGLIGDKLLKAGKLV